MNDTRPWQRLSRRAFLIGMAAAAAALAVFAFRLFRYDPRAVVDAIIDKRLAGLRHDREARRQFVEDFMAESELAKDGAKLRVFHLLLPVYRYSDLLSATPMGDYVLFSESDVIGGYLLNSSFFRDGADTDAVVRYQGNYGSRLPCANPFANRSFPAT